MLSHSPRNDKDVFLPVTASPLPKAGDPMGELLKLRPLVLASGSDRLLGAFNQLCVAALVDVERND